MTKTNQAAVSDATPAFDDRFLSIEIANERMKGVSFKYIQKKLNIDVETLKATTFNKVCYEILPKIKSGEVTTEAASTDAFWNIEGCDKELGLEVMRILKPGLFNQSSTEGETTLTNPTIDAAKQNDAPAEANQPELTKAAEPAQAAPAPGVNQKPPTAILRREEAGGALFFTIVTNGSVITLNYESVKSAAIVPVANGDAPPRWNLRITTKPEKRLVVETGVVVDGSDTYDIVFDTPEDAYAVYPFSA